MKVPSLSSALREKNERDFVEVTGRLQIALSKIESDPKLKPTQQVLSRLAGCSRGTLNNRRWPLEQLKLIKESRKKKRAPEMPMEASLEQEKLRIERYKEQLFDSREEVLVWKTRHDEVASRLSELQTLTTALQRRNKELADELVKLRRQAPSGKVIDITLLGPKN